MQGGGREGNYNCPFSLGTWAEIINEIIAKVCGNCQIKGLISILFPQLWGLKYKWWRDYQHYEHFLKKEKNGEELDRSSHRGLAGLGVARIGLSPCSTASKILSEEEELGRELWSCLEMLLDEGKSNSLKDGELTTWLCSHAFLPLTNTSEHLL